MTGAADNTLKIERSCALIASVFSEGRRRGARLVSGERRGFGLSAARTQVTVPYPALAPNWTLRSLSCGIALQCAPSKDRISRLALRGLGTRELHALTIAEAEAALGWVHTRWPGLASEFARLAPELQPRKHDDEAAIIDRAQHLARSDGELRCNPLIGQLSAPGADDRGVLAGLKRLYGQMPWSSRRQLSKTLHTIPVGGQGGVQNPNLPPPSRPEDEDPAVRNDARIGLPYPEWNYWSKRFLPDHVAVLERKHAAKSPAPSAASPGLRRWFEEHTHRAMRNRLEDGSDLDIDSYVRHFIDTRSGRSSEARVFRDLLPSARDVTTALLIDGSSSLGAAQGRAFKLELACADALCQAMATARERHGLFLFSGNTRHRVDVTCLKDFDDPRLVMPGRLGLQAGGYTRLGAPIRHLTRRLVAQLSERRLLIVLGDGLMSDEGYEGKYAWHDVAHAVEEAGEAGVSVYYIGVGATRVDPLPDVFGKRRSQRIQRLDDLPRALAHVHRELVAA